MDDFGFEPKSGSLRSAVHTILGHIPEKSAGSVKLRAMAKSEWSARGLGRPLVVPFQRGATDHCYALELVLCDETDPKAVSISNYASEGRIDEWANDLWVAWIEAEDD